jgi:hypothetical protein
MRYCEVQDTSKVNVESAPVLTRNDSGLVFLGGPLRLVLNKPFLCTKARKGSGFAIIYPNRPDNTHF